MTERKFVNMTGVAERLFAEQAAEENGAAPKPLKEGAYRKYNPHAALAAFIAGCLVAEDVIPFNFKGEDGFSDLECAIRIIAACLEHYSEEEAFCSLPFEW